MFIRYPANRTARGAPRGCNRAGTTLLLLLLFVSTLIHQSWNWVLILFAILIYRVSWFGLHALCQTKHRNPITVRSGMSERICNPNIVLEQVLDRVSRVLEWVLGRVEYLFEYSTKILLELLSGFFISHALCLSLST